MQKTIDFKYKKGDAVYFVAGTKILNGYITELIAHINEYDLYVYAKINHYFRTLPVPKVLRKFVDEDDLWINVDNLYKTKAELLEANNK